MIPIAAITTFLGSGKGKLIIGLALAGLMAAGFLIWIASLKGDIADLKGTISERDSAISELREDIAGFKLQVRNQDTEIHLLKESGNQTARTISGLREQVEAEQEIAKREKRLRLRVSRLLSKAKNQPITNSTGVISHEDSRLAAEFLNDALGLRSQAAQQN